MTTYNFTLGSKGTEMKAKDGATTLATYLYPNGWFHLGLTSLTVGSPGVDTATMLIAQIGTIAGSAATGNTDDLDIQLKTVFPDVGSSVGAGEAHIGSVSGIINVVGVEFTRPADTNAYIALDCVSNSTSAPTVLTFTNLARVNGGSGYITKVRLVTDKKDCVAQFRIHPFHTAPTAVNDNAAYPSLYANDSKSIGAITLPLTSTEDSATSTAAGAMDATLRIPYQCDVASRNISVLVETLSPFTPASGQKFYIEITVDNN